MGAVGAGGRESVGHGARRSRATAAVVAETATAVHVAGHRLLLGADKRADAAANGSRGAKITLYHVALLLIMVGTNKRRRGTRGGDRARAEARPQRRAEANIEEILEGSPMGARELEADAASAPPSAPPTPPTPYHPRSARRWLRVLVCAFLARKGGAVGTRGQATQAHAGGGATSGVGLSELAVAAALRTAAGTVGAMDRDDIERFAALHADATYAMIDRGIEGTSGGFHLGLRQSDAARVVAAILVQEYTSVLWVGFGYAEEIALLAVVAYLLRRRLRITALEIPAATGQTRCDYSGVARRGRPVPALRAHGGGGGFGGERVSGEGAGTLDPLQPSRARPSPGAPFFRLSTAD